MKKRIIATMLAAVLTMGMLAGCGNFNGDAAGEGGQNQGAEGAAEIDFDEEPYEATVMYYAANDPRDLESVENAFNELTLKELNMKVHLMPITFGTYGQQIQLLLSGDEPLDIVPFGSGDFGNFIQAGYIEDLNQYLDAYGQDIKEIVGEEDIRCCELDGFLAAIPNMHERTNPLYVVMRTDLLEETGFTADDIKDFSDLTPVFAKVKENHPEMLIYGGAVNNMFPALLSNNMVDGLNVTTYGAFGVLEDGGQTTTVTNLYESEGFKEACYLVREWFQAGYISADIATSTDTGEAQMKAGNLFSFTANGKPDIKAEKDASTGYDTTCIKLTGDTCYTTTTNQLNYGISSNSQDPEKAMILLNWIYKTKEANDLLNWGVEGKDYEVQEDGTIDYPEGVTAENVGYHQGFGFAMPNQYNSYVWAGNDPAVFEQYQEVRDNAQVSKAYGFIFNTEPVINEWSALTTVGSQYLATVVSGTVDVDTALEELNQELYNAGLQKVMDEKQKQLDEWLAQQ